MHFRLTLALISLVTLTTAMPFDFKEWLNSALPRPGSTLKDEIKCYSLPYGAIGFVSHLLTYYTLIMLALNKSPWTWKRNKHWKIDLALAITGMMCTLTVTILTMIRCRQRWQFVLIAFWKLTLSLSLSAIATHGALNLRDFTRLHPDSTQHSNQLLKDLWRYLQARRRRKGDDETGLELQTLGDAQPPRPVSSCDPSENITPTTGLLSHTAIETHAAGGNPLWLSVYLAGEVIGFVGLFSIVHQLWDSKSVRGFTEGWLIPLFVISYLGACLTVDNTRPKGKISAEAFNWLVPIAGVTGALYSDWVLAAIDGNYAGIPDGNNFVLYWTYFAAKRLPFLSF